MSVQAVSIDQLRRMEDQEGLVIQGCGGNLQEWVDGINEILAEEAAMYNVPIGLQGKEKSGNSDCKHTD